MKIMFYALRPFDEQQYCEPYKARYGIDYTGTPDVPRPDNLHLAEGCDAVSTNPCEIRPEYLQTWAEMGVKYLPCRSIGYDHIPLDTAEKLGLRRDQVMAVGDSGNELSMIDEAGLVVAMSNATPEILAAADAVTADNNHDGVALAIEKYALHR